jgi:CRISPR-associated protein Csd1
LEQQGGDEMILQALCEYYKRKAAHNSDSIAPQGFEYKEIPFVLVLDKSGAVVNLENTYEGEGKNKRAKRFLVPKTVKKSSGISSNLLWENPEYALGIKVKSAEKRVVEMHDAFIKKTDTLGQINDDGYNALKRFLSKPNKGDILEEKAKTDEDFANNLTQMIEKGLSLTFRLQGENNIIAESQTLKQAVVSFDKGNDSQRDICLVSGRQDFIERVHPAIKGVWGCQSAGGNIVSFNTQAFCSYGKEQSYNAPMGKEAVFSYTTALNALLDRDLQQRIQVGDASTIFWAEKENKLEKDFLYFFNMPQSDNPDAGIEAVKALFQSVENGMPNIIDGNKKFYVLGLSPNAARISVRFFVNSTIKEMSVNIYRHFKDLEIVRPPFESEFLPLFKLLCSTAAQGKADNIAPHLSGDFMIAVLKGLPYPKTLLQALINRIKAEQRIDYYRAALIKAYLNRLARYKKEKEEITVSLNENANQGYVLGRLFATLEKLQSEAQGDINSTVMRYYGTASSSPVAVFANLMRLHQHHLNNLKSKDRGVYFKKLISEIQGKIDDEKGYPSYLSLAEQGMFAIGYYQQRQDFFKTKEDKSNTENQVKGE